MIRNEEVYIADIDSKVEAIKWALELLKEEDSFNGSNIKELENLKRELE